MTNAIRRVLAGVALFAAEFALTLLAGGVGVAGFLALGRAVLDQGAADFDAAAFRWSREALGADALTWVQDITFLASRNFITVAALLLIGYFLVRRHRWYSLLVPVVALGSITLNLVLKGAYHRPRPSLPLVAASGLSFPSGHAMIAASFYGLLIYLVHTHVRGPALRRLRWLLITALVILILAIGLSRIYLRVHYASDVLAGFVAGLVWLLVAIPLLRRIEKTAKSWFRRPMQTTEKQA